MRSLNTATRNHSVRSLRSPLFLSFHFSVTATRRFATFSPDWSERISGSAPKCPIIWTFLSITRPPALLCFLCQLRLKSNQVYKCELKHEAFPARRSSALQARVGFLHDQ